MAHKFITKYGWLTSLVCAAEVRPCVWPDNSPVSVLWELRVLLAINAPLWLFPSSSYKGAYESTGPEDGGLFPAPELRARLHPFTRQPLPPSLWHFRVTEDLWLSLKKSLIWVQLCSRKFLNPCILTLREYRKRVLFVFTLCSVLASKLFGCNFLQSVGEMTNWYLLAS